MILNIPLFVDNWRGVNYFLLYRIPGRASTKTREAADKSENDESDAIIIMILTVILIFMQQQQQLHQF